MRKQEIDNLQNREESNRDVQINIDCSLFLYILLKTNRKLFDENLELSVKTEEKNSKNLIY